MKYANNITVNGTTYSGVCIAETTDEAKALCEFAHKYVKEHPAPVPEPKSTLTEEEQYSVFLQRFRAMDEFQVYPGHPMFDNIKPKPKTQKQYEWTDYLGSSLYRLGLIEFEGDIYSYYGDDDPIYFYIGEKKTPKSQRVKLNGSVCEGYLYRIGFWLRKYKPYEKNYGNVGYIIKESIKCGTLEQQEKIAELLASKGYEVKCEEVEVDISSLRW